MSFIEPSEFVQTIVVHSSHDGRPVAYLPETETDTLRNLQDSGCILVEAS